MRPDFENIALAEVHDAVWGLLAEGVAQAASPFHTPALATSSRHGTDLRTVVLRHADPASRTVSCHTDWRSPKRRHVQHDPRVAWLIYDRQRKLQVRLRGRASLHHLDDRARERWSESTTRSRVCYSAPLAPGTPVREPAAAGTDPESGWQRFTVLFCRLQRIDFLYLSAGRHRRAILTWEQERWDAGWVAP